MAEQHRRRNTGRANSLIRVSSRSLVADAMQAVPQALPPRLPALRALRLSLWHQTHCQRRAQRLFRCRRRRKSCSNAVRIEAGLPERPEGETSWQLISSTPGRLQPDSRPSAVAQVLLISGEDGARQRMAEQLAELSYEGELADLTPASQYTARGPCSDSMMAPGTCQGAEDPIKESSRALAFPAQRYALVESFDSGHLGRSTLRYCSRCALIACTMRARYLQPSR